MKVLKSEVVVLIKNTKTGMYWTGGSFIHINDEHDLLRCFDIYDDHDLESCLFCIDEDRNNLVLETFRLETKLHSLEQVSI